MKAITVMSISLLTILCWGCSAPNAATDEPAASKQEPEFGRDSTGVEVDLVLTLNLRLKFVDAAGKNLVEGIETQGEAATWRGDKVRPDLYKMTTQVVNPFGIQPNPLRVFSTPDGLYLVLSLVMDIELHRDYVFKTATYTLVCPYVFGDDKAHTVVAYGNNTDPLNPHYTHIEVDGTEYAVKKDKENPIVFYATVVVDR